MGELRGSERGILTELDRHLLDSGEGLVAEVSRGSYLVADVRGARPRGCTSSCCAAGTRPPNDSRWPIPGIAQGHLFLGPMSNLISNRRRVLARICEDDVRAHDILSSCGADLSLPPGLVDTLERNGIPGVVAARMAWTSSRRSRSGPMARWSPLPRGRGGVTGWRCSWPRTCGA